MKIFIEYILVVEMQRIDPALGYIDAQIEQPFTIFRVSEKPVLSPGEVGLFDDSGVSLACIVNMGPKKYLYYLGWNLGVTVPWRNSIGLAIYNEKLNKYEKIGKAPIMDRNEVDPYSLSYPFVMQDCGIFKMWYGTNLAWGKEQKDMSHVIRYAESNDGKEWRRRGEIAIGFKNKYEFALSKPCVMRENGIFKMWYSYRASDKSEKYRIGYSESYDGIKWERRDEEVLLDVSTDGWDSEMICYPYVFTHNKKKHMLYNGNDYGKTGIGLATLEE